MPHHQKRDQEVVGREEILNLSRNCEGLLECSCGHAANPSASFHLDVVGSGHVQRAVQVVDVKFWKDMLCRLALTIRFTHDFPYLIFIPNLIYLSFSVIDPWLQKTQTNFNRANAVLVDFRSSTYNL
jgi:hypothetical protein